MQASLVSKSEEKKKTASSPPEGQFSVQPIQEETSDLTRLPLFLQRGVQTKLTAGAADDPLEREADQIAERVLQNGSWSPASGVSAQKLQRKCQEEEPKRVQAKRVSGSNGQSASAPAALNTSGGEPLSGNVKNRVEPVLGVDLSPVRVHTDASAQQDAQALRAKAFTHQNHIWLGKNQSAEDVGLMAHEATHAIQQAGRSSDVLAASTDDSFLVQRQPLPQLQTPDPQAEAEAKEIKRKYDECKLQVVSSLTSALRANSDQPGFISALTQDIAVALGPDVTNERLVEVQNKIGELSGVAATVHNQTYDYVSAAKLLSRFIGLPPELTSGFHASYGTAYFISLVSSDVAGFIAQPMFPAGNMWSFISVPYLSNSLGVIMDHWGDPQGVLDLELQGSIAALVELRGRFIKSQDQSERANLGAQIGELSRRILLIHQELLDLGPPDQSAATGNTPLDRALQSVAGDVDRIRAEALSEESTLSALGNRPELLHPVDVTPEEPLGPEISDKEAVSEDEAFPRISDKATLSFLRDLSGRVQNQASQIEGLHNQVVPASPSFSLQEFAEVYGRWFSFFSVAGRDQDPFYQQAKQLYEGLFQAVGIGGVQGGLFRAWMMQEMQPDIEGLIGGASADFSQQLISPQRRQSVSGTATSPQYEYGDFFPGTFGPLSLQGETGSRGQFQATRQRQTMDLFQRMAEARQRQEPALPLAVQAGMARGPGALFLRTNPQPPPPQPSIVKAGMWQGPGLFGPGPSAVTSNPQSQALWHYLVETVDVYGNATYEEKVISPEVSNYLLARIQQRATLLQAHQPGIGDLPTVTGGVEAGQATGTQVYVQGQLGAVVNPEAERARAPIQNLAQDIQDRKPPGFYTKSLTPAQRETALLISELEAYLNRYFIIHTEPEYRVAAVLLISEAEYHASAAFWRSLTPAEIMKALGIALAITAIKQALSLLGELGAALGQGIDLLMSLMGVSTGAALVNMAAWLREAMAVQTFRQARASGFFAYYVADDLGQLVQMYIISGAVHGLGELPRNPETPRNAADALRMIEPFTRDPASRDVIAKSVEAEIQRREAQGSGRDRSDPVYDQLRAVDAELRGQSRPGDPMINLEDIPALQGEGATRGRDVYRLPASDPRTRRGAVDPRRITGKVAEMAGMELIHGSTLAPQKGTRDRFQLTVPDPVNPKAAPRTVSVTVRVEAAENAVWRAAPTGTHGGEEGPARLLTLTQDPSGKWNCTIVVHEGVHSEDVAFLVGHELNEVSDLLARNPSATPADIARETAAGVFAPGSTATDITAHDRAAARELSDLYGDVQREKSVLRPDPEGIRDRQSRLDRMIRAMGLEDPSAITDAQIKALQEAGVPHDLILDIRSSGARARQAQNFRAPVTDFREAQPMMSAATGATAAGHGRSKHWADAARKAMVLDILNSPGRIFTGVYERTGRRVDIYYRDGNVVITDAGQKDRVITGYGGTLDVENPRAVDPNNWAGNPAYEEVPVLPR